MENLWSKRKIPKRITLRRKRQSLRRAPSEAGYTCWLLPPLSRSLRKAIFRKDTHSVCLVCLVRNKSSTFLVVCPCLLRLKQGEKRFHMQINLQSSSLNKIKQVLYGRTSRNLENSDWHSQSPKGEFNITWSISPKINGPHYCLGKGPYLLELVLHGTHLGTHRSGVILCDALLKESCEYSVQLDKCFSFLSLF